MHSTVFFVTTIIVDVLRRPNLIKLLVLLFDAVLLYDFTSYVNLVLAAFFNWLVFWSR